MEFEWDSEHLSVEPPLEGPSIPGEEGHLQDEVQQSCWLIRGSGGDDQSSSLYRCYSDP